MSLPTIEAVKEKEDVPHRPRARDIGRVRNCKASKKRLHILLDPDKHAFDGWENQPQPWTKKTCERYIDWCHIDKIFPHSVHRKHCKRKVANLHFCKDPEFLERCIQVHQHLYDDPYVARNESSLAILRMVYAEQKLLRTVDWSTIKTASTQILKAPESIDIPRERKYKEHGGLSKAKNPVQTIADVLVQWSDDSDVDLKSGCTKQERDDRLQHLRDAQYWSYIEASIGDECIEGDASGVAKTRNDSSINEPSSNPPENFTEHFVQVHDWSQPPQQFATDGTTTEPPIMTEGSSHHSIGQNIELSNIDNTTSVKTIEDLQVEVAQLRRHNAKLERKLKRVVDYIVDKEIAYKKKIEDLEIALHRGDDARAPKEDPPTM